jgi:hypothetical protein
VHYILKYLILIYTTLSIINKKKKNIFIYFIFFLGAGGVKKPVLPPINPKTGKPFEGDEFDKNPFKNTG